MKTKILLPEASDMKILVSKGDTVTRGTVIAEFRKSTGTDHELNISKLLKVNPSKISKYLKKSIGDRISVNEVIAKRSSLFFSFIVKSPLDGRFKEIDLSKGTFTVTEENHSGQGRITSFLDAKISHVDASTIEIEFKGEEYSIIPLNDVKEVVGRMIYIDKEIVDVTDVDNIVSDCIVLCKSVREDTLVKMEVLGVLAVIITGEGNVGQRIPCVSIEKEKFNDLISYHDHFAWIRPLENKLIVIGK
jgi:hypothetical protein